MTGQLNEHPLGELIREIYDAGLSGALRLFRERAKAVVYFDSGEITYAATNLRTYRLSECVRRWGVLNEQQQHPRVQDKMSDQDFGEALIEIGAFSRESLEELIAQQASEMLCHALLWMDGEWEFDPRVRLKEGVRVHVKVDELLMESARRLPASFVASKFSDINEKLSLKSNAPDDLPLLPTEAFVLTRIDAPVSINELLAVGGLPENEALHVIYTLTLSGLLSREKWPQALSADELTKARAVNAAMPKFVEAESKVESAPPVKVTPAAEEKRDEKAELYALFERLDTATNYYQMLDIGRAANDPDVKRAYHSLAKRFHPDRFRKAVDDELYARIESAFAQIAQAYETLKSKQSRAVYDSKLLTLEKRGEASSAHNQGSAKIAKNDNATTPKQSDTVAPPPQKSNSESTSYDAEERFKQGLSALQSGNHTLAISCLGEAARLIPSQPRYRAYYGRALASQERMQRSAEAELKTAISLDANNSSYRVMLAELYIEIGLLRRAQGELERVLSIDPRNETARNLLGKLKR
jgi:curved DNA-binding protein CbpA